MIDLFDLDVDSLDSYIRIEKLSNENVSVSFPMKKSEYCVYSDYIMKNALAYQNLFITNTYLLIDNETNQAIAFISIICDSVIVTQDEKSETDLMQVPFSTFPAVKIAQLAVSSICEQKYNHVGSFLIDFAADLAYKISINFAACRFLTVDADIDNNPDSPVFYEKNGFCRMTDRKYTKKTKMVCMYKDIFSK